jgi:hypothetical protein
MCSRFSQPTLRKTESKKKKNQKNRHLDTSEVILDEFEKAFSQSQKKKCLPPVV